jgi:hypothetical protein
MTMMFVIFINPDIVMNMIDTMGIPTLLGIAGLRIAFGLLLFAAAATSRWPMFLKVMGLLFVCGGLFVLLLGVDGVREITDLFYGENVTFLRAGMVFAFGFFGLIAYALMSGNNGAGPDAVRAA